MHGLLQTNTFLQLFRPISSMTKGDGKIQGSDAEIEFGRILAALKLQNTPGFLKLVQPLGAGTQAKAGNAGKGETLTDASMFGKLRIRPVKLPDDVKKTLGSLIKSIGGRAAGLDTTDEPSLLTGLAAGTKTGQTGAAPLKSLQIELPQLKGTTIQLSPGERKAVVTQTDESESAFSLLEPEFLSLLEEAGMASVQFVSAQGGQIEIKFSANDQSVDSLQVESIISNVKKLISEFSAEAKTGNAHVRRAVQGTGGKVVADIRQTEDSIEVELDVTDEELAATLGKAIPEIEASLTDDAGSARNASATPVGKTVATKTAAPAQQVSRASHRERIGKTVSNEKPASATSGRKIAVAVRNLSGAADDLRPLTKSSGPVSEAGDETDVAPGGKGSKISKSGLKMTSTARAESLMTGPATEGKVAIKPDRATEDISGAKAASKSRVAPKDGLASTGAKTPSAVKILDQVEQIIASFDDLEEGSRTENEFELAGNEKAVLKSEMKSAGAVHELQVSSLDLKEKLQARLNEKGLDVPEVELHKFEEVKTETTGSTSKTTSTVPPLSTLKNELPELPPKVAQKIEQLLQQISEKVERSPELLDKKAAIRSEVREVLASVARAIDTGRPFEFESQSPDAKIRELFSGNVKGVIKGIGDDLAKAGLVKAPELESKPSVKGGVSDGRQTAPAIAKSSDVRNTPDDAGLTQNSRDDGSPKRQAARPAATTKPDVVNKTASEPSTFQAEVSPASAHKTEETQAYVAPANNNVALDFSNGKLMPQAPVATSQMAEMIKKFSDIADAQTSFTGQKLEVQMEVKEVGKVMVDALRHMDKINLQIHVDSHEARKIIESQIRPLVEQMSRGGVDIGKLDVTVRDQRQDQPRQQAFEGNSSRLSDRAGEDNFSQGNQQRYPRQFSESQLRQMMTGEQTVEIWI